MFGINKLQHYYHAKILVSWWYSNKKRTITTKFEVVAILEQKSKTTIMALFYRMQKVKILGFLKFVGSVRSHLGKRKEKINIVVWIQMKGH